MRSNQIHQALSKGINRFEVCQLVSKGVRVTHKSGSRFEDSINDVLEYLGTHEAPGEGLHPAATPKSASLEPAA
ncbi:MAG TPA: DNA-directed RNA polymerase subunit omega [Terracidiphilus sp.]|nr:DNA-directed RNA polymerase subunit omega [Terracidiphilus sp.]